MDQIEVYEYIEENYDFLFPNNIYSEEEIERAMLGIPQHLKASVESLHRSKSFPPETHDPRRQRKDG